MAEIHKIAASGFAEGTNDLYDRARPSYPSSALSYIHSALPSSKPLTILEPGSGTGIFSRLLLSPPTGYPEFSISKLVGIEPSSGMRNAWQRGLEKIKPTAQEGKALLSVSVDGSFDDFSKAAEEAGVKEGEADAVIIAQAWHWCPGHESALREIGKYLSPGSPLILVWNLEPRVDDLHGALFDLWHPYDQDSPQYYTSRWRAMFDTPAYSELFQPVEEDHFQWTMPADEDWVVNRTFSKSFLTKANFPDQGKREKLEQELREVIRKSKDKKWIDEKAGIFEFKHDTDVFVIRKK